MGGSKITRMERLFVTALVLTTQPALTRAAREAGLGTPTTNEKTLECYEDVVVIYQWWTGGVVWREDGSDEVEVIELRVPCAHENVVHGRQNDWCADCGHIFAERQGLPYVPA